MMLLDLRRWVWTLCLVASMALATAAAADSRVPCARHPLTSHHPEHYIEHRSGLFRRLRPRPRPQYNAQGLTSGVHPGLGALLRWDNRRLRAKKLRAEERAQAQAQMQPTRPRQQPFGGQRFVGDSPIGSGQASPEWFTPPQSPTEQLSGLAPMSKKQSKKKWWKPGGKILPKCLSCSPVVE